MKSNSPVKKHHFWILLGLVPLLTLIAVLMVSSKVGGKTNERQKAIDKASSEIKDKTDPKSDDLLRELDKVAGLVEKKQGTLHGENWKGQEDLFVWPGKTRPGTSKVFADLEQKGLKFGDTIPDLSAVFGELQRAETYQHEYSSLKLNKDGTWTGTGTGMADLMTPTQFNGGWQSVLRYVDDFENKIITKDQTWLILEDMWVQRSLLSGLRSVNTEMGIFERVKYEKNGTVIDDPATKAVTRSKTQRLFRNRTWELAIELVPEGTSQRLTGTLTNISDRLQLLGTGNVMTLNVWLAPGGQPIPFTIGGEYLPGRGSKKTIKDRDGNSHVVDANVLAIVPMDAHVLPAGSFDLSKLEIARVEQVFDIRTVPIKRIDALVMGEQGVDARSKGQPLVTPRTPPFTESYVKDPVVADGMGIVMPPGMTPVIPMPPTVGTDGMSGAGGGRRQAGTLAVVADGNKKRYLAATEQVRRMPVGLVVVVDQSYMQDVLLALSNSPLRFQITQVTWTRFRGTLSGIGPVSSGGPNDNIVGGGMGSFGGFSAPVDPDDRGPRGGRPVGPLPPPTGGTGVQPMGPSGPGFSGSGAPPAVSDSQITSGLVELSVYGVVSLYEKYEAVKPADGTTPVVPPVVPPAVPPNPAVPPKKRRRHRA